MTAKRSEITPTAWRREWRGDVSDIGNMIYEENASELDEPLSDWEPLYGPDLLAENERLRVVNAGLVAALGRCADEIEENLEFEGELASFSAALAQARSILAGGDLATSSNESRYLWVRNRLSVEDVERMAKEVPLGSTNIDEAESAKCDSAIDTAKAKE